MIKDSIAFSSFSVKDLEAALQFYSDTLRLRVEKMPEGLELHFANGMRIFIYPSSANKPADFTVLNFLVDDINEAVDELTERGVVMEQYDIPPYIQTNERGIASQGGSRAMAWFKDPSGNILALLQEK